MDRHNDRPTLLLFATLSLAGLAITSLTCCAERAEARRATACDRPSDVDGAALVVGAGSVLERALCRDRHDWLVVPAGGTVRLAFDHAAGDLDVQAFDVLGRDVDLADGRGDQEVVRVPPGGRAMIYGYMGASNRYRAIVE